jgi:hypothetical protein
VCSSSAYHSLVASDVLKVEVPDAGPIQRYLDTTLYFRISSPEASRFEVTASTSYLGTACSGHVLRHLQHPTRSCKILDYEAMLKPPRWSALAKAMDERRAVHAADWPRSKSPRFLGYANSRDSCLHAPRSYHDSCLTSNSLVIQTIRSVTQNAFRYFCFLDLHFHYHVELPAARFFP